MSKIKQLVVIALLAGSAFAAEDAQLRNGFSIRHDHRAAQGQTTRLFISADEKSFVDIPTADIANFEKAPVEAVAPPATIPPPKEHTIAEIVRDASDKHLIDEDLIQSIIRIESSFNQKAVSRKGAQGLMQLMPATARKLGVTDSFNSQENVDAGTRYLHELLVKFNFDLVKALAAYNAGPQRVTQYKGVPPYSETQAYVRRIIKDFNRKKMAAAAMNTASTKKSEKPATKIPRSKI